jgi:hypothetical protein
MRPCSGSPSSNDSRPAGGRPRLLPGGRRHDDRLPGREPERVDPELQPDAPAPRDALEGEAGGEWGKWTIFRFVKG